MKGENHVTKSMPGVHYRIIVLICGGLLMGGCVMAEKYDAEKARSLNFQRLLAQEEKRTGELDSEAKRSKNELMEYEARNRELTAQVQSVREQLARVQEEAEAMKESALLERKAKAGMKRTTTPTRKSSPGEPTPDTVERNPSVYGIAPTGPNESGPTDSMLGNMQSSAVHVVKPGETLYRISRQHGIAVDKIRKWNKLPDDIIEVGQRLIVGQEQ
jgi:LysM repeat protein